MLLIIGRLFTHPLFLCLFLLFGGCSKRNAYPYYEETPVILPKKAIHKMFPERKEIYLPLLENSNDGPLVVIDPGHGGKDMGTQSVKGPKYYEKNITLSTSFAICQYLKVLGFKPIMTRDKDEFIELKDRAQFANDKKPIAFVSLHFNSAPSRQAEGIEVYYYNTEKDKGRVEKSKLLAAKILDSMLTYTKAKSRGVKHGNFLVIRETEVPAVIVEGGFMTNDDEMQNIRDGTYLKKLAWGIAQGIKKYAASKK